MVINGIYYNVNAAQYRKLYRSLRNNADSYSGGLSASAAKYGILYRLEGWTK